MIEQDNKNTNEHMESNNTNSSHEDTFEKAWRITEFSKLVY